MVNLPQMLDLKRCGVSNMGEGIKTRRGKSKGEIFSRVYLYNEGDECTAITGGWVDGFDRWGNGTKAKNTDNLYLKTTLHTDNSWRSYATNNAVDITSLNKLYIQASVYSGVSKPETGLHFGVSSTKTGTGDIAVIKVKGNLTAYDVYVLDVSAIVGSYYITINACSQYNDNITEIFIKNVWGE